MLSAETMVSHLPGQTQRRRRPRADRREQPRPRDSGPRDTAVSRVGMQPYEVIHKQFCRHPVSRLTIVL